ncbi:MAG: hypothetical protein EON58_18250 [Alphaproteobacteria bacterium]|nr:MAG: hypothetical protein EON58_18250 [Alphaproteobacteria bacterium]
MIFPVFSTDVYNLQDVERICDDIEIRLGDKFVVSATGDDDLTGEYFTDEIGKASIWLSYPPEGESADGAPVKPIRPRCALYIARTYAGIDGQRETSPVPVWCPVAYLRGPDGQTTPWVFLDDRDQERLEMIGIPPLPLTDEEKQTVRREGLTTNSRVALLALFWSLHRGDERVREMVEAIEASIFFDARMADALHRAFPRS